VSEQILINILFYVYLIIMGRRFSPNSVIVVTLFYLHIEF